MSIIPTQEELKRESYQYFNDHVRPIETYINEKGVMRARDIVTGNLIGTNDDLDAFRHAYVMGKLVLAGFPSSVVKYVGIDHEDDIANNPQERDMDLWNNYIGITLSEYADSPEELGSLIKSALENGTLITAPKTISDEQRELVTDYFKDLLNDFLDDAQTISDFLQDALNDLLQSQVFVAPARRDPLSLDLDGDGLELVNVNESTAFFDLDVVDNGDGTYTSDGFKEQVGWVKGDDGILTLDKNNNGTIDNILELFGKENKTGTEELREYDLNGDGKIDSQDSIFNQLKVWQDVNQDGVSQSGELKTLSQLGIASINLNNLVTKNQVSEGNLIISEGSFTKVDGSTGSYSNLDLAVNQVNSSHYQYEDGNGNVVGDYNLNLDVLSLPFLRGYADVKALPIAASEDEVLLSLMKQLNEFKFEDNIDSLVEKILYRWTGVDDIDSSAMRGSFSAQKLAVFEAIRGEAYVYNSTSSDVPALRQALVQKAWDSFYGDFANQNL
jgi:hypothetical protein